MSKIGIVGAGQSGLQLGIGLRKAGYEVVLISNQSGEQIRAGRVTSSQCMFASALGHERELGHQLLGPASVRQSRRFSWPSRPRTAPRLWSGVHASTARRYLWTSG